MLVCVVVLESLSTGCRKIDESLGGGIPAGKIGLVYGEAESGKTTLAMQFAVDCARQGYKTLYVDCDEAFSTRRFSQIASDHLAEIADQIVLMRPKSFTEQSTLVDQLPECLVGRFGLLAIDTVTSFYRAETGSPSRVFDLNRELNRQMAVLAQIAKTRRVLVLVLSQVRFAFSESLEGVEPVAPRVLRFWADVIMVLKPTGNRQIVRVILEKGGHGPEPVRCYLRMDDTGIHEHKRKRV